MSYETRYAAKKQAQLDRLADSPEAVAWRLRDNEFRAKAYADMQAAYPEIATADDAYIAHLFFEARLAELHTAYNRGPRHAA